MQKEKDKDKDKDKDINMNTEQIWTEPDPLIPSDTSGSYTGVPINNDYDEDEKPIQDADDL